MVSNLIYDLIHSFKFVRIFRITLVHFFVDVKGESSPRHLNHTTVPFNRIPSWYLLVCYYHVTYVFQSESTLSSGLNINELLARSRCDIWRLSDRNIWLNGWVFIYKLNGWEFKSLCCHMIFALYKYKMIRIVQTNID